MVSTILYLVSFKICRIPVASILFLLVLPSQIHVDSFPYPRRSSDWISELVNSTVPKIVIIFLLRESCNRSQESIVI
jgi:hypothetical protein